jgi:hypothetical protein
MNEQDRDLILGLTEGTLTGEEAERARARILSDPELASELAVQESVRADLSALPSATLTGAERTALRSSLRERLNLGTVPQVAPERGRRRLAWWQPVLGVASVAVVVTAIVVLPGTFGGSDDSGDSGGEALTETTVAATDTAADGGIDDGAEEQAPPPTTEVLAFDDVDGADLLDATRDAATPDEVTDSLEAAPIAEARTFASVPVAQAEACLEELDDRIPPGDKTLIGVDETADGLLVYFAVIGADGVTSVLTVNLDDCTLVDIDTGG